MKLALASLAALAVATPAFAQGDIELGAAYSHFDADGANLNGCYFRQPHRYATVLDELGFPFFY